MTAASNTALQPQEPPRFPYQLVDAYLYDCSVERNVEPEGQETPASFTTSLEFPPTDDLSAGAFHALLRVSATYRFREGAFCIVTASAMGVFQEIGELDEAARRQFKKEDCAVLLWPYARSYAGQLAQMMGVHMPLLPTLDVRLVIAAGREGEQTEQPG